MKAVELNPIDRGLKLMLEGKYQEAWKISEELEAQGPDEIVDHTGKKNPEMWVRHSFNRGWFLVNQGKYQEGHQLLENGRFLNVYGGAPLKTDAPLWNPEEHPPLGKSIILSMEGGLGDEIIGVRFARSLKYAGFSKVYVACSPELKSIFARIPDVDKVILRNETNTVQHDYWIPAFSAGWVTGNTEETLYYGPYLTPDKKYNDKWEDIIPAFSKKLKIGIRWAGNPKFEHQQFRIFPPEYLLALSKYSDQCEIYSFQRDNNLVNDMPSEIIDLQHKLETWDDTLSALYRMDLVITSCTSVAHAAAAMGKPTWIIVPVLPYYTWAYGAPNLDTSPYYSSVKLFRQTTSRVWGDTFQKLYNDLEKTYNLKHVEHVKKTERLKLNLGCGFNRLPGFINIDASEHCEPDMLMDIEKPWDKIEDGSVEHIVAKDILEHVGKTPQDFINVLKEMYRVSCHGAVWEVQFPHHRCDIAFDDPTHVRLLTETTFRLFDKKRAMRLIDEKQAETPLALMHNIDIEVLDVKHVWVDYWAQQVKEGKIKIEELENYYMKVFNNVALSVIMLITVHKNERI